MRLHTLISHISGPLLVFPGLLAVIYLGIGDRQLLDQDSRSEGYPSYPGVSTEVPGSPSPLDLPGAGQLFGEPSGHRSEPEFPAPVTRLDLTLKATFTHSEARRASALISAGNKPSRRYRTGEEIAAGVRLKEVHTGFVTLSRNNRREVLRLPILEGGKAVSRQSVSAGEQPESDSAIPRLESTPREHLPVTQSSDQEGRERSLTDRLQALREKRK